MPNIADLMKKATRRAARNKCDGREHSEGLRQQGVEIQLQSHTNGHLRQLQARCASSKEPDDRTSPVIGDICHANDVDGNVMEA